MDRRSRGHCAAMTCDFMHHDRGFGHAETGTAVLLRHRDAEPTGVSHRPMKFERKDAVIVARPPTVIAEAAHDRATHFPDRGLIVRWLGLADHQRPHACTVTSTQST